MSAKKKIAVGSHESYINRELSWLSFARRVLALAEDTNVPLLERIKFAGIMGMLYDEFSMKRIGGLRRRIEKNSSRISSDGLTLREELDASRRELHAQCRQLRQLVDDQLRPALAEAGIPILDYEQLDDAQKAHMQDYFHDAIEPILTPLAVDVSHPFPFISNLGLNLAVQLKDSKHKKPRFVRIKIPPNRPRWVELPDGGYVPLEQVIAANLAQLFPSAKQIKHYLFRVARGAKDDPWERVPKSDEEPELLPGSIIGMVTSELTARKFAGVVRLQLSADMPKEMQLWLTEQLNADPDDIETWDGLMALTDLIKIQPDGHPALRDPPHKPVTHPRLKQLEAPDNAIFAEIQRGNILLHHPYHDYETSIVRFLRAAAYDPRVLAIKLSIYRTSTQSPVIQALIEAARRGKQVAVLVEITARFDEAPNIVWGETLEKAGAHVIYGMERLKTHVKLGLVVREEADGIRRYVHVATGNYHPGTARLYEDLGILSCDPELSSNVAAVFNELTGAIEAQDYGHLLVSPHNLRQRFTEMIQREAEHARAGLPSGISAKMNQLQDRDIIKELYLASQAGVPITLNVRGLCSLKAGVPGLSDNIQVFSILGRFLEHGRIYRFENAGEPEYFIGSADWMRRNLDSRMEAVMPVLDAKLQNELETILHVYENDNITAWDMLPDGNYVRRSPAKGEEPRPSQEVFIRLASELDKEETLNTKNIKQQA
ncbi:MAG: polyphosphate kinase 1 [Gammaproteobacteria bacterium]|nr:polyphosphate kinase 1 [Gammaproteobacteria bacterium]